MQLGASSLVQESTRGVRSNFSREPFVVSQAFSGRQDTFGRRYQVQHGSKRSGLCRWPFRGACRTFGSSNGSVSTLNPM